MVSGKPGVKLLALYKLKQVQTTSTVCHTTGVLSADVFGNFSLSSISAESLYIQMYYNKLTLGDDNHRYTA